MPSASVPIFCEYLKKMIPYSVSSIGGYLLASIQEEIDDAGICALLTKLTDLVVVRDIHAVILDLQNVEVVDSYLAIHLEYLASTLNMMCSRVVVVGLGVPAVMTLLDFGIKLRAVEFALDVEQALVKLLPESNYSAAPHL